MSATLPSAQAVGVPARADAPDQLLAARAAAGDTVAFEALYDRYAGRVLTLCERVLGSSHDAADAAQETFIRFLRRLPGLDVRHDSVAPYLFTCARHVCFDLMGRGAKVDVVDELPARSGPPVGGREADPATEDPERSALIGDSRAGVREACLRLSPRHREVLYLREVEELSYEDIGEVVGLNANAVAQLLSRARLRLRDELRGGALAAFARSSPDCERATALLSSGVDGRDLPRDDRAWLASHAAGCDGCRLAGEALAEAGRSYRLLAPLVPLEVLRRETLAKAAEPLAELRAAAGAGARGAEPEDGAGGGAAASGSAAERAWSRPSRRTAGVLACAVIVLLALVVPAATSDDPPVQAVPAGETSRPAAGAAGPAAVRGPAPDAARPSRAPSPGDAAAAADPSAPVSSSRDAPALSPRSSPASPRRGSRRRGAVGPSQGTAPAGPGGTGQAADPAPPVQQPSDPAPAAEQPPADAPVEPVPDPPASEPPAEPEPDRPTRPRPPPSGGSDDLRNPDGSTPPPPG